MPRCTPCEFGPLPDDECTRWLADGLAADLVPTDAVPVVRQDRGADVSAYLSPGMRKTLRKARNRLATDGLDWTVVATADPQEITALLPFMAATQRDRDREHDLECPLDTAAGHALWRGRLLELLATGLLEVTTLSIAGEPVAYVAGVVDGRRYGVLEGRFATAWARYSPGRLLEAAVLERTLGDARFVELDWMTGVAPEALLAANATYPAVRVCRASGAVSAA